LKIQKTYHSENIISLPSLDNTIATTCVELCVLLIDEDRADRCLIVCLEGSCDFTISLNVEHLDLTIGATNNDIFACLIKCDTVDCCVANISRENLRHLANIPQLADAVGVHRGHVLSTN
jgi:hypothetical protein